MIVMIVRSVQNYPICKLYNHSCNALSPNDAAFISLDCPDNGVIREIRQVNCHEKKKKHHAAKDFIQN